MKWSTVGTFFKWWNQSQTNKLTNCVYTQHWPNDQQISIVCWPGLDIQHISHQFLLLLKTILLDSNLKWATPGSWWPISSWTSRKSIWSLDSRVSLGSHRAILSLRAWLTLLAWETNTPVPLWPQRPEGQKNSRTDDDDDDDDNISSHTAQHDFSSTGRKTLSGHDLSSSWWGIFSRPADIGCFSLSLTAINTCMRW